ncbi:MAG: hypothetical protein HQ513_17320 [Rhodospirillales bacterium]|nr:hypothetical protein [Rhodospirillales bacterium]
MIPMLMAGSVAKSVYQMQLATFASGAKLARGADLTGLTDTKVGTFSVWFDIQGVGIGPGSDIRNWYGNSSAPGHTNFGTAEGDSKFHAYFTDTGVSINSLRVKGTQAFPHPSGLHHVMFSWDSLNTVSHLYVDGAAETKSVETLPNYTHNWTTGNSYVGAYHDGTTNYIGDMGDLYINLEEYMDLSVLANREKFIKDSLPVDLGSDGSGPTGNAPIMLFSGDMTAWHTNKGTGGGFTKTGTVSDGGTYPA